jgi:nucleoside-diphosphate-sugar epimerase
MKVLVTGAGGFIGGHLVQSLIKEGHQVFTFDRKWTKDWWQYLPHSTETVISGLALREVGLGWVEDMDEVYHLAADMGGIGFITKNLVSCSRNIMDTISLLDACKAGQRVFFASSACVYPVFKQETTIQCPLRESDVFPADPEPGYGWEKLSGEQLMRYYREERGIETRVARYHNVYGPHGSWCDGREKAPAALCRKVATAVLTGDHNIDIWGDGEQTRSFMYVDDCVHGTKAILRHDNTDPLNLGSGRLVTVNELLDIIEGIAGVRLTRHYDLSQPQGVRGRNSDNTKIWKTLHWEPDIKLEDGLEPTYKWIHDQVKRSLNV